jgi:hypothetical protein
MALVTNVFRRGAAYHFRARGPETFWRSGERSYGGRSERCRQTWRDEVSKRLSADAVIDASKIEVASHDGP